MKEGKLNFLIGGPAGAGIEKSGKTLTTSLVRAGYYVYANVEHMSQIRGGNNYLRLRVDTQPHEAHIEELDLIIALDKETIEEHIDSVSEGGAIVFDNETVKLPEDFDSKGVKMIDVPLKSLAIEKVRTPIMANVIALGLVCGLIEFDVEILKDTLAKIFSKKGDEVIGLNRDAAQIGFELASEHKDEVMVKMPTLEDQEKRMFIMGNDAFCVGAVKAGVKFVGEYPMTPSSSVLHFMARWSEKYGIVVKHTEDEIAACNSIIGAGFAGVRALTGTSGGGFALMTEAIGLAAMNEVPIVICNVMRPGPATGLPTRTEAGDLRQVIHAGQGDPVKIVLLPGTMQECFDDGFDSFNLAEKYQLPVIVTFDKAMGESFYTAAPFDDSGCEVSRGSLLTQDELSKMEDYKRYLRTDNGISPRSIPGMKGGIHRATSDEHDEYGDITEDSKNRELMMEKRLNKVEAAREECPKPVVIGDEGADITFVTWGSGVGASMDAIKELAKSGKSANILQIRTAWPFHTKEIKEELGKIKRPILVDSNYTAQMGGLITEHTGIIIEEKILRYDGRPLTGKYITDRIK
jgi:2-oxoglutarate/2-oxoacid ferredoxin oxidoreductase subunit alpha